MFGFSTGHPPEEPADPWLVRTLSLIVLGLSVVALPAGQLLHRSQRTGSTLVRMALKQPDQLAALADPAKRAVVTLRMALVLRLALLEAVALFGIVVCYLAVLTGTLHESPLYWLNGLPAVLLALHTLLSFPTRDRMESALQERFSVPRLG